MNVPKTVAKRYQLKDFADRNEGLDFGKDKIKSGDTIAVDVCPVTGEPIFAVVDKRPESKTYICRLFETVFDNHYHAYRVQYVSTNQGVLRTNKLPYRLPVSRVRTHLNIQFIVLRHAVI